MASMTCKCVACGHVHSRPMPTREAVRLAVLREAAAFLGAGVDRPLPTKGEDAYAYKARIQAGRKE